MTELVYPPEPAPLLKGGYAKKASDMLPVVDQNGFVIGQAARDICHGGSRFLHPVVHLHIIDRAGRLYIQRRSETRTLYPGRWDTAVGGHVGYGELFLEALFREASEELGLTLFNPIWIAGYEHESDTENELVNVYAAVGSFELHPDGDEVSEGRWWTQEEIASSMGKGLFTPNFESEYMRLKDKLLALL